MICAWCVCFGDPEGAGLNRHKHAAAPIHGAHVDAALRPLLGGRAGALGPLQKS